MGFKPQTLSKQPKSEAVAAARRKVSIRFTERQWEQLRVYMFKHRVPTLQSLVLTALSDKLDEFDL